MQVCTFEFHCQCTRIHEARQRRHATTPTKWFASVVSDGAQSFGDHVLKPHTHSDISASANLYGSPPVTWLCLTSLLLLLLVAYYYSFIWVNLGQPIPPSPRVLLLHLFWKKTSQKVGTVILQFVIVYTTKFCCC